jgi:fructose-bisphosphate aldolase class 1
LEFPHEDSLKALSAMSEEERRPAKLAASLAAALKEDSAEATASHLRLLKRQDRILAALSAEP